MSARPVAVVIGDMDLVRPLGLAGVPVVVAGSTSPETRWSRYTQGSIELTDLWKEPEENVDRLIAFGSSFDEKPVLYFQSDSALVVISRHRDVLSRFYRFAIASESIVESLVDKSLFRSLCPSLDLPIPDSTVVVGGESGTMLAESDSLVGVRLPVILKPAVRNRTEVSWYPAAGWSAKAARADTVDELRTILSDPHLAGMPLIMQQLIEGPEDRIWSYHCFVDQDGRTVAEYCGQKIRTWPAAFGQSTSVRIEANPGVAELGRLVIERVGLTGVAKVDFKEDPDGLLHLLEINPRFSLWHHAGATAGINIPELVYRHLQGERVSAGAIRSGVEWCQVWTDYPAARAAGIGIEEWARFVGKAEARRALHLEDPGAALGALAHGLGRPVGRRFRSARSRSELSPSGAS